MMRSEGSSLLRAQLCGVVGKAMAQEPEGLACSLTPPLTTGSP